MRAFLLLPKKKLHQHQKFRCWNLKCKPLVCPACQIHYTNFQQITSLLVCKIKKERDHHLLQQVSKCRKKIVFEVDANLSKNLLIRRNSIAKENLTVDPSINCALFHQKVETIGIFFPLVTINEQEEPAVSHK